jgi:lipid-A-disaccharide synthase
MKFYLIAGEASGDLHGSGLIKALREEHPGATFRCWGGDLMENAGATLVKHYRELAFMGFWEVVKNLPAIARNFRKCKADILEWKPDALLLIDYPGFNLRMAKWAKTNRIRTFYYISPQLWAWHSSRVKIIEENIERMFVILPFEQDFYEKHGVQVDFTGHPLLDVVEQFRPPVNFFTENNFPSGKPLIALLPGSRRQEIGKMLDVMLKITPYFPDYHFVIAGAPSIEKGFYQQFTASRPEVSLVENQTYALLKNAHAALVTSGTATLETALFDVPQVVCYKGSLLSYFLARQLVNKDLKFIAIVNLIAGKRVVQELIQNEFTPVRLRREFEKILLESGRKEIKTGYAAIRQKLGETGAARRIAKIIFQRMQT